MDPFRAGKVRSCRSAVERLLHVELGKGVQRRPVALIRRVNRGESLSVLRVRSRSVRGMLAPMNRALRPADRDRFRVRVRVAPPPPAAWTSRMVVPRRLTDLAYRPELVG